MYEAKWTQCRSIGMINEAEFNQQWCSSTICMYETWKAGSIVRMQSRHTFYITRIVMKRLDEDGMADSRDQQRVLPSPTLNIDNKEGKKSDKNLLASHLYCSQNWEAHVHMYIPNSEILLWFSHIIHNGVAKIINELYKYTMEVYKIHQTTLVTYKHVRNQRGLYQDFPELPRSDEDATCRGDGGRLQQGSSHDGFVRKPRRSSATVAWTLGDPKQV